MSKKFRTVNSCFQHDLAWEICKNYILKRMCPIILSNSGKVLFVFSGFTKGTMKKIELLDNKENNAKIIRSTILYFSYPITSTIFSG